MLPREVGFACIEQDPGVAMGVGGDAGADFVAVRGADDERANGIGAVVESNGVHAGERMMEVVGHLKREVDWRQSDKVLPASSRQRKSCETRTLG